MSADDGAFSTCLLVGLGAASSAAAAVFAAVFAAASAFAASAAAAVAPALDCRSAFLVMKLGFLAEGGRRGR